MAVSKLFKTQVEGPFGDVRYCHCSQCRRKSGTAFTANAKVSTSQWSIVGPIDVTITGHVWVSSKAEWYKVEDSLP